MAKSNFSALNEEPFLSNWQDNYLISPEKELEQYGSLTKLQNVMTRMMKNNTVAIAMRLASISMLFGGKMFTRALIGNSSEAKKVNKLLEDEFKAFDLKRFYSKQYMFETIMSSAFMHGDCLILLPYDDKRGDLGTYIELVEGVRIQTPSKHESNPLVRNGVAYDNKGRILGYYARKLDSMNSYTFETEEFDYFPAWKKDDFLGEERLIAFLFKYPLEPRPQMARQYPVLAGSSRVLRYVIQYIDAVIVGSRFSACQTAIVTTNNPVGAKSGLEGTTTKDEKGYTRSIGHLMPGNVLYVNKGTTVSMTSPSRPPDNAVSFSKLLIGMSCAQVRLSYAQAMMDLEGTSYSSWRGGSIEAMAYTNRLINSFSMVDNWITRTQILEMISKGIVNVSLKTTQIISHFPKYTPLDEEKKSLSDTMQLANQTKSRRKITEDFNFAYDTILEERRDEAKDDLESKVLLIKEADVLSEKHGVDKEVVLSLINNGEKEDNENKGQEKIDRKKEGNWE